MALANLKERVTALVQPIAGGLGLFLHDLEVIQGKRLRIRVFAERKSKADVTDGITIDECAELSRQIDQAMELDELVGQSYLLEVSSPGLERKLKNRSHFEHAVGERLEVIAGSEEEGETTLIGRLERVANDEVTLDLDGETTAIPLSRIRKARTIYRFEF